MTQKKRIVWPFEPSDTNKDLDRHIKKMLMALSEKVEVEIQPVCVMGSRYAQMGQYFESYDDSPLKENLLEDCANYLKEFSQLPLKDFILIDNYHTSQSAETMLFGDYLEKSKPDFVVVASHGRKGWERTFLGSFTESLLLRAECPVFVLGPKCEDKFDLSKALMPVEINPESGQFIEHFLDNHLLTFVKSLELFHKISLVDYEDIAWAPTFYGVVNYSNEDVMTQARKSTEKFLSSYMNHPLSQKRLKYSISESIDAATDVIIKASKEKDAGLLIMHSQAGPWEARLLGSVTKTVIREATIPVLVYPYHYEAD